MPNANPYSADQVKRSLIHFIVGKSSTAIIGFALLLLVVRALPASEYGVYIALLAALEIIQLASNVGLIAAAYRYIPEIRSKNQGAALHQLLVQLSFFRLLTLTVAVALIGLFTQSILLQFNLQGFERVVSIFGFIVVAEGFSRYLDILFDSLLLQRFSQIAILFRNGLRLAGLLIAIHLEQWSVSLSDWVMIELIASFLGALLSAFMLFRFSFALKISSPGLLNNDLNARRFLVFALPSYLAQLTGLAYGPETTKLILSKISDAFQVGAFGFAASISAMLQRYLPVFLLLGLVRPLFVSTHDSIDRNGRLNQLSSIVLKLNVFVLFPSIAFILASGDRLAGILSGGKFPDAGNFLLIFMVLLVFQTWHAVLSLVTLAVEDGVSGLQGTVFGLLGLLGGVAFLPEYGSYSLSLGLVLSEAIWCSYVLYSLRRTGLAIKNDWIGTAKISIYSIAGWAAAVLVEKIYAFPESVATGLDLAIVGIVFIILSYLFKPFTNEERTLINKILPRPVFVW